VIALQVPKASIHLVGTGQADTILVNSRFTARVFKSYFPSIRQTPSVVYPGINIDAYQSVSDASHPDIVQVTSWVLTTLSVF
jgi:alpha-1,3/alpha-1,6-mannosyltransferase